MPARFVKPTSKLHYRAAAAFTVVAALVLGVPSMLPVHAQTAQGSAETNEPLVTQGNTTGGNRTDLLVTQFIQLRGGMQENELLMLAEFMPFEVKANSSAPSLYNTSSPVTGLLDSENITEGGDNDTVAEANNTQGYQQGLGHVVAKLPCDDDGNPEVSVLVSATPSIIAIGVAPDLAAIDMGEAVEEATLGDVAVSLSDFGTSCLYHADLPAGITSISLLNTSDDETSFDEGGMYYVVITAQVTPRSGT